jgi:hypothetical protein
MKKLSKFSTEVGLTEYYIIPLKLISSNKRYRILTFKANGRLEIAEC